MTLLPVIGRYVVGAVLKYTLLVMLATVLVHERAVFLPYVDGVL